MALRCHGELSAGSLQLSANILSAETLRETLAHLNAFLRGRAGNGV
jgi:hypothetical protein